MKRIFNDFLCALCSEKTLNNVDPKPPLLLRERAGVRGNKKKIIQFQPLTTPTPASPVEGEGKDEASGDSFHGLWCPHGT
jgi:hypothetical protein